MGLEAIVKKDYVENDPTLCFKTTPVWKILVLGLCWGWIYILILVYNYWKTLKDNFGYKINSFLRAFFNPITNFWLFSIFDKYFRCFGEKLVAPCWLAFLYFILSGVGKALDKITWRMDEINLTFWVAEGLLFIVELLLLSFFMYIQSRINKINKVYFPDAPKNGWTIANTIWTVLSVVLFIGSIILLIILSLLPSVE